MMALDGNNEKKNQEETRNDREKVRKNTHKIKKQKTVIGWSFIPR